MKNCIKVVFLKFGNNPMTVFFWHISKSVFPVFQFPLYMIFLGEISYFLLTPFSVSKIYWFQNIYLFI